MAELDYVAIAKEMADIAISESLTAAQEEFTNSTAAQVRAAAKDLIDYVNYIMIMSQQSIVEAAAMQNADITQVYAFSKKMIKEKDQFKELMTKVMHFQNIANAYLGQTVQMTFVYIDKKTGKIDLYAIENDIGHLTVDRASSSHGGTLSGRYKYSKKMMSEFQKFENQTEQDTRLEPTFQEVYKRYNISKSIQRMKGAAYILWKDGGEWDGAWISGAGPLGEAYFNFFINNYIFSNAIEPAVGDFMINNSYGAVNADNASGFLQGDVSKNGVEYGIKMMGATALGYMDIIDYAQSLLEASDVGVFLRNLKEELANKASSNLVMPLAGKIEEVTEDLLSEMEKRVNSLG